MAILRKITTMSNLARNTNKSKLKMASRNSIDWFKKNIQNAFNGRIRENSQNRWILSKLGQYANPDIKGGLRSVNAPMVGSMYFFIYDAKYKETLPYYDALPLVFPFDYTSNGFYGINFHYLPMSMRGMLMDSLLSLKASTVDTAYGQKEYLRLSYQALQGVGKGYFKPTVKRYLYSQIKSKFAEVHSDQWENAMFLPVENFQKAGNAEVWRDSRSKI